MGVRRTEAGRTHLTSAGVEHIANFRNEGSGQSIKSLSRVAILSLSYTKPTVWSYAILNA